MRPHGKHHLSNKKESSKSVPPVKSSKVTNNKNTIELINFTLRKSVKNVTKLVLMSCNINISKIRDSD